VAEVETANVPTKPAPLVVIDADNDERGYGTF
jgi:hypothetical protein